MEKLKLETDRGFKEYYDELNKRIIQELGEQEIQQNEIKTNYEGFEKKKQEILTRVIYIITHRKKRKINSYMELSITLRIGKGKYLPFIRYCEIKKVV
jgi:hypothetical protein